jgi:hypothetical protein
MIRARESISSTGGRTAPQYWGRNSPRIGFALQRIVDPFLLAPNASQPETLVEAPFMFYHQGYYYLLYSGDNCCSRPPSYAVMVARSRNPLKPFTERSQVTSHWGESTILHFNDRWDRTLRCIDRRSGTRLDLLSRHRSTQLV